MAAGHWDHRCFSSCAVLELVRGRRKHARPHFLHGPYRGPCFSPSASLAPDLFTPEMADSIHGVSRLSVGDPVGVDVVQDSWVYWRCSPDSGMALV